MYHSTGLFSSAIVLRIYASVNDNSVQEELKTMASEQSNPQIRALHQCSAKLVTALSAVDSQFSWELLSKELIGYETVEYCRLEVTPTKKSSEIVSAVIKTVSASPHPFDSLVSVLSESGNTALMSVGEKLKNICPTPESFQLLAKRKLAPSEREEYDSPLKKQQKLDLSATSAEVTLCEQPSCSSDFSLTPSISLRKYQTELAQYGLKGENYILTAPTGTGKTLIAAYVISEHLKKLERRGKIIFVTNTRPLAQQQTEALKKFIPGARIQSTMGGDEIMIGTIINGQDIIVCTAGKLREELKSHSDQISICQVSLLVIDECHHITLKSEEGQVMQLYLKAKHSGKKVPQVIGLTASPGAGDSPKLGIDKTLNHLLSLCALMDARSGIKMVQEHSDELERYTNKPNTSLHVIQERDENEPFIQCIRDEMIKLEQSVRCECPYQRWSEQYETAIQQKIRQFQNSLDPSNRDEISTLELLCCYSLALSVYMDLREEDVLKVLEEHCMPPEGQRTPCEVMLKEGLNTVMEELKKLKTVQNPLLKHSEDIICKHFTKNPNSQAIFFVSMKKYTRSICDWLLKLPNLKLKPDVITGHSGETSHGMTDVEKEQVIQKFRQRKSNILVATSVAEEGLDIPACNLVIRFQHVTNDIATVQYKGRARERDASAFTLVSSGSSKHLREMKNEEKNFVVTEVIRSCFPDSVTLLQKLENIQHEILRECPKAIDARDRIQCESVQLLCIKCKVLACNGTDVFEKSNHHLVQSDGFKQRYVSRPHPERKKTSGRTPFEKTHKIYCAKCDQQWGIKCIWNGHEQHLIKCASFVFKVGEHYEICKKWSNAPFKVRPFPQFDNTAVDYKNTTNF